ncbi:MAG: hypothetical protein ACKOX6_09950, partial [Bdellovibrio sp.]
MKSLLVVSAIFMTGSVFLGCSHKEPKPEMHRVSSAAQQTAQKEDASYVTEFSFKKGSAVLTENAKSDLRRVISDAKQNSKIKEVKVITWSDSEYPSSRTKKLSSSERDLVKKRNDAIRDYMKSYSNRLDVDTYSMAERPGVLQEMFNTSDARIKKSMQDAGIATTESPYRSAPKSSKSVVMVV